MKVVEAKLVSRSKERKFKKEPPKAQVIVHGGEGENRYSSTRHVTMQAGVWIGRNPDPRAEELHKRADEAIERAQASLQIARKALETIKEASKDKNEKVSKEIVAATEKAIADYEYAVKKLGEEKEELNRDYPPTVQFNF